MCQTLSSHADDHLFIFFICQKDYRRKSLSAVFFTMSGFMSPKFSHVPKLESLLLILCFCFVFDFFAKRPQKSTDPIQQHTV